MLAFFAFLLVGVLLGCSALTEADSPDDPRELSQQEQAVVFSAQQFGLKLFAALHEEEPDQNLFISPLSVSMALGMALNGADEETHDAIMETLAVSDLSEEEINQAYQALSEHLTTLDPSVTLGVANSVWYRNTFSVEDPFIEKAREYFDAEVEGLDFSSDDAADAMNAWVAEHTEGRIEEIVEAPIDPLTMLFLINAVYFEGDWTYQFDPDQTRPDTFTRLDGSTVEVDMMRQSELEIPFYQRQDLVAAELPYGEGHYRMTLIVPTDESDVNALADSLGEGLWEEIRDSLQPRDGVRVELPTFTLEWEETLNDVLRAVGMEIAFDPGRSNFSRINPEAKDLHISEVKHSTFLRVDEEGTEAAAATGVGIGVTSAPPTLRADRPFILVIRDDHSDTIVFMGKIIDPTG